MREGERVMILSGEQLGETGIIIGPMIISRVQELDPSKDISIKSAITYYVVQLDENGKQDVFDGEYLKVIKD